MDKLDTRLHDYLGKIYKYYRDKVSVAARYLPGGIAIPSGRGDVDYNDEDAQAGMFGNSFRGLGIVVAILGVLTAWSKLYPADGRFSDFAHVTSLVLLLAVVITVWRGNRSQLRPKWIILRAKAEAARYAKLAALIEAYQDDEPTLFEETELRLVEQIAYNTRSHAQYANLGLLARYTAMLAFALLLANAAIAVISDISQADLPKWADRLMDSFWLFSALPALAGGLAGANGFLRIGQLADDHKHMAAQLQALHEKLLAPQRSMPMINLAKATRDTLAHRDSEWVRNALTQNLSTV